MTKGVKIPTPLAKLPDHKNIRNAKELYDQGVAGLVEGGGYQTKGVWRACEDCRMRTNDAPAFCPVCQRAIERIIRFYTEE